MDFVTLAHPSKLKAIVEAKVKTDKIDSALPAHILRCDLISATPVSSAEARIGKSDEQLDLVDSVPGIGENLSILIVTEIDDINRFSSVAKLHSYAELIPSAYSSDGHCLYLQEYEPMTQTSKQYQL